MSIQKKRLGDILIDCNLITDKQLHEALEHQKQTSSKLGETLIKMNIVTEDDIIWALGNQLNISFIHPSPDIVDMAAAKLFEAEFAHDKKIIPLYRSGNQLSVCMVDPLDYATIEQVEAKFGVELSVSICTTYDFEQTYAAVYGSADSISRVSASELDATAKQKLEKTIPKGIEAPEKVINYILGQAVINKVDKIHFEPSDKGVLIRFRTSSMLTRKIEVPAKLNQEIIKRLKKLSQVPENTASGISTGHFRINVSGCQINIQSIFFPTISGEMVILKLNDFESLAKRIGKRTRPYIDELIRVVKHTHGILYVSGPRESGRTTTQYNILNSFDFETNKIVTVEDPVTATFAKMTQIQVGQGGISSHIDGLKLALLLDADIVYVDRLYNKELAAEMAFAALGGKTILTSLLAHDAPSTVVKLLETGVDPVIVASSLCGFVCQRLIRVLCPRCKQETEMPKTLQKLLPPDLAQKKVFAPLGCEGCNGTGYYGRTLITEFLPDSQILRQMIVNKQSYRDFKNLAKKQGIKSLETKAMQLVLEGETSPDEYMRLF